MAEKSTVEAFADKIAALTKVQRIVIFIGTFVLLGSLFFYLFYQPKSGEINELEQKYDELQVRLTKATAAAKNLKMYQKKYKEAQGKFRLVLRLLPDKKEIPTLLENISKSGRHSGLEFMLFKPSQEVSKGFYAEIPVEIKVTGGYHNLATFFDKVAKLSRVVTVSNVKIKGTKGDKKGPGTLEASCVATTYRFIETSEAPPVKGKKK
jgi:type IV pilus assembly protein PilO